jgi:hypothetical protein
MTRSLACSLSQQEILDRADKLAHLDRTIEDVEIRKAEASRAFKDEIDQHHAAARALSKEIRERATMRDVEVVEHRDATRFVVEWIRQDTLEIVENRRMTDDEIARARQGKLPLERKAKLEAVPPATADGGGPTTMPADAPTDDAPTPSPSSRRKTTQA